MFKVLFLVLAIMPLYLQANKSQTYTAIAKNDKNDQVYLEQHEVQFAQDRVQNAKTKYLTPDGKVFAELSSDFAQSITSPDYTFKDYRDGSSHGITVENDKYTLWRQGKETTREQKEFLKSDFDDDVLIIGCQGLHYYLISNLPKLREKKSFSIKYLIPGKLDYFSFTLLIKREDNDFIYLKMSINSLFLKLFASNLDLKYRKSDLRLIEYSGLSNITSHTGKAQSVKIDYNYEVGI